MDTPIEDQTEESAGSDPSTILTRRAELLDRDRTRSITAAESLELAEATTALTTLLEGGSVRLRHLTLDSDGPLLGRLAGLEPVHPFTDPTDITEIRQRTEDGRRCYVLENSSLPGHPLNTVWIALLGGLPTGIHDLIGKPANALGSAEVTTVVFYSIWNVEGGLAGIPGGSSLLAILSDEIRREFPNVDTLTTLSPITGFRQWLTTQYPDMASHLDEVDDPGQLTEACVSYLLTSDDHHLPIDDVARFHMRNGARLWRLVPDGDRSARGLERSWGMMANYRYWPEDLAANRESLLVGRPAVGTSIVGPTEEH